MGDRTAMPAGIKISEGGEGAGKTPPRGQARTQSPALKFHPYMLQATGIQPNIRDKIIKRNLK